MATVQRYVGVNATDPTDKIIKMGPLLWDGETEYDPGPGVRLILEAEALEQGYTWPPQEGSGETPAE